MTIADFLYQASFWQWVGLIFLAAIVFGCLINFRIWGNITNNNYSDKSGEEK